MFCCHISQPSPSSWTRTLRRRIGLMRNRFVNVPGRLIQKPRRSQFQLDTSTLYGLRDWICQQVTWLLEVYSISIILFFTYFMEIKNWLSHDVTGLYFQSIYWCQSSSPGLHGQQGQQVHRQTQFGVISPPIGSPPVSPDLDPASWKLLVPSKFLLKLFSNWFCCILPPANLNGCCWKWLANTWAACLGGASTLRALQHVLFWR